MRWRHLVLSILTCSLSFFPLSPSPISPTVIKYRLRLTMCLMSTGDKLGVPAVIVSASMLKQNSASATHALPRPLGSLFRDPLSLPLPWIPLFLLRGNAWVTESCLPAGGSIRREGPAWGEVVQGPWLRVSVLPIPCPPPTPHPPRGALSALLARLCCSSPQPSLPPSSPPFLVRAQKCLVVCGTLHSLFGGHLPTSTVVMTVSR